MFDTFYTKIGKINVTHKPLIFQTKTKKNQTLGSEYEQRFRSYVFCMTGKICDSVDINVTF